MDHYASISGWSGFKRISLKAASLISSKILYQEAMSPLFLTNLTLVLASSSAPVFLKNLTLTTKSEVFSSGLPGRDSLKYLPSTFSTYKSLLCSDL